MVEGNIANAKIIKTMLGSCYEGKRLTFYLDVKLSTGNYKDIGGYELDTKDKENTMRVIIPERLEVIPKILDVVGVKTWEDLNGKYIRVIGDGLSKIDVIGNLMEDKWINFKEYFDSLANEETQHEE